LPDVGFRRALHRLARLGTTRAGTAVATLAEVVGSGWWPACCSGHG
jgi:hypothetical protein